jgi:hypothetical protein
MIFEFCMVYCEQQLSIVEMGFSRFPKVFKDEKKNKYESFFKGA